MTLTALKATPPASAAHARITLPYPHFQKLERYPWKPWVMPGVAYKLLSINRRSGGFTCLLKVDPGTEAPVHHHLGAIEVIVLEGDIYYERNDIGIVDGRSMLEMATRDGAAQHVHS